MKANANSKNPSETLTVLSHPPDFGSVFNQLGNIANSMNGNAKAEENPNIPTIGAIPPFEADSTNKVPTIGPVQENETIASAKAMNKIPTTPPLSACLSTLFAHELGHYLGLPHTFQGWEGKAFDYNQKAPENWENIKVERADGSNCKTAGDGFCDTAPDYLSLRWSCADSSKSPIPQVDPMGKSFYSDGSLIMGYALDPCPNRFSKEQIITMRGYSDEFYSHIIKTDLPLKINKTEPATLSPADFSQTNINNGVTFNWEKVPGTYKFIVEISPMPNLAIVTNSYEISGDSLSLKVNNLIAGRRYYWRLRSLNLYTTCLSVSKIKSFNTVLSTSSTEINRDNPSLVKVNPINQFEGMQLNLEGQSFPLSITLTNSSGQLLLTKNYAQYVGLSNLSISVSAFPPGQYTLTVRNAQKTQSHSVVIMP